MDNISLIPVFVLLLLSGPADAARAHPLMVTLIFECQPCLGKLKIRSDHTRHPEGGTKIGSTDRAGNTFYDIIPDLIST